MKPATSNWHAAGVCQGPSSNLTKRKSGCGSGLKEFPEIWGFLFNISATAEASGIQLWFAKAHQKKKWVWSWAREASQHFAFSYNISAMAGASDFQFGKPLGFF